MLLQSNVVSDAGGSLVNIGGILTGFIQQAISYLPKIVLALIVLWIGFKVIGWISKLIKKQLEARSIDPSLTSFLSSIMSILMKAALFIAVAQTLGVAATSFVAILGAAGLAVGLALQGSLANFAGGVMILLFKPFAVGEYIRAQNVEGFVREINVFVTKLVTHDGITHFVPNGPLANGNVTNVAREGKVRLHIPIIVSYDTDVAKLRSTIMSMAGSDPLILKDPAPELSVVNTEGRKLTLDLKVWCEPMNEPAATVSMHESTKKALDSAGIEIPFPVQVMRTVNAN